ncbi:aldehyde dehydrogenase family protein [Sinomonas humi]|uniref:Aldehyde dehydrogenase domain-containing protein n=1 Tax=Sinomonas humi TaxID=1338436 RepID=A0A0B2ACP8_9MICC|nr:aldehyde dehydrogenase family protein [Sinomonas humi]KHL01364.1 hypothetical protein LK10_15855 [Sinomonas humi]
MHTNDPEVEAIAIAGNRVDFQSPIGGFKNSGIGREAGPEGFDAYIEIKSYGLPPTALGTLVSASKEGTS